MFAGAVRETVFSRPEVLQRVNAEFIPLAVKATLANQVFAAGDSQEDRFYGRLKSVQVAPQGICALNSDGQVLIWTEMFDDDKNISSFLDHTLRLFRDRNTGPTATERYVHFQSNRVEDAKWASDPEAISGRHAKGAHCSAQSQSHSAAPRGSLVASVVGRALDNSGLPSKDTLHQEKYIEDHLSLKPGDQKTLARALAESASPSARIPKTIAREFVKHAHLSHLDVQPLDNPNPEGSAGELRLCDFRAIPVETNLWRIEGQSEAFADVMANAGPGDFHEVKLTWEGFFRMDGDRMTDLVLFARGTERLKFGSQRRSSPESLASSLNAGQSIDLECGVVYGILGEPIADDQAVEGPQTPGAGPRDAGRETQGPPPSLVRKMQKLQPAVARWQRAGKDLSRVGTVMQRFEPLIKKGKLAEAEAVLDEALAVLDSR